MADVCMLTSVCPSLQLNLTVCEDPRFAVEHLTPRIRSLPLTLVCALVFASYRILFDTYWIFPLSRIVRYWEAVFTLLPRNSREPFRPWDERSVDAFLKRAELPSLKRRLIKTTCRRLTRKLKKISESVWKCSIYIVLFFFGLFSIWNEPALRDPRLFFLNYPSIPLSPGIFWYYMMETGFFITLLIFHVRERSRSDFLEMLLHHIVTIFLLLMSWTLNLVKIGAVVAVLHDIGDIFLDLSRFLVYIGYGSASRVSFGVFVVAWLVTRLLLFPYVIIRSTLFTSVEVLGSQILRCHVYYELNLMLLGLFALHIFWSYMICKVLYGILVVKKCKDCRSPASTEIEDSEAEDQ